MNLRRYCKLAVFLGLAMSVSAKAGPTDQNVELPQDLVSAIRERLHDVLKDPESARIKVTRGPRAAAFSLDENYLMRGKAICAEINAKNSYGAYVGVTTWVFLFGTEKIEPFELGDHSLYDNELRSECDKPADPIETKSSETKVLL